MRLAVIAFGSRGDVQPYIALGSGLEKAGHEVRLVTHENFEALVRAQGLAFHSVEGSVEAIVQSAAMRELTEKGNVLAITRQTAKEAQRVAAYWARDALAAAQGVDVLVTGVGGLFTAFALAEKLDLPLLQTFIFPYTPTTAFASVLLPASLSRLGGAFNHASHHLTQQVLWQGFRSADTLARRSVFDLPPASFWGPFSSQRLRWQPVLYGFSPSVIAKPADWDARIHVTGYWFLDEPDGWTPPADLLEFLDNGPPPVYIGFGSMGSRNPQETGRIALEALARSGQRGVLAAGWGGLQALDVPDTVHVMSSLPHSWLFPRMAAVVHHGGAGTTAAGLRAGVPSIIIPFFGDQPFWGERVRALGVGPAPVARRHLSAEKLAQAITTVVSDQALRQRAAALGERIRAEDGIARAVALVEQHFARS